MIRQPPRDYRVAVPSYRRPLGLSDRTLSTLINRGVHRDRITVFLHDHDPELAAYRTVLGDNGIKHRVTGARGITEQRREIIRAYPAGTPLVQVDDDVINVVRGVDLKTLQPVDDLHGWFVEAFAVTAGADLYVWGVNAVANAFFMRPGRPPSTGLKFLIGSLWGCWTRPGHPVHDLTVPVKEDYETSLRAWWWDGGAVRFDDIAVKADHYTTPGGCQEYRDPAMSERVVQQLITEWPGLVRRNTRRKSGHAEILLAPKKRHAGKPATEPPPGVRGVQRPGRSA